MRIPAWSQATQVQVNGQAFTAKIVPGGYLAIKRTWAPGDRIALNLDMRVRVTASHPEVRENTGRVAIERGPLVYCLEQHDQSEPVTETALKLSADPAKDFEPEVRGDMPRRGYCVEAPGRHAAEAVCVASALRAGNHRRARKTR